MSIDPQITAGLAEIAETLELLAGITPTAGAKRDVEIIARLSRINDALGGGALEAHILTSHPDVAAPSPSEGDFLRYDAGVEGWLASSMVISDATDVTATPTSGTYLRGNGTIWTESSILFTDLPTINLGDLGDTTISSPGAAEYLRHDGTDWKNANIALGDLPAIALNDLTDVTISGPAQWEVLKYNSGSGLFLNAQLNPPELGNTNFVAGTADSLVLTDAQVFTNTNGYGASDLLLRNGSRALTADWDAGAFDITAQGLRASNSVPDVTDTAGTFTYNLANVVSGVASTHIGLDINMDYDFDALGGFDLNTARGFNLDVNATTTNAAFSALKLQAMKCVITNDAATGFSNTPAEVPFFFQVDNQKTDQSFSEGAFHVLLDAGTDSNQLVASKFVTSFNGAGRAFAYQGYVDANVAATGTITIIDAFSRIAANLTSVIGVSSRPRALGTAPDLDLVCSFRGEKGHALFTTASLFVTSTLRALPTDVPTTHLDPTVNEGAGYFEGLLEVDGTLYADENVEVVGDMKFTTAGGGLPYGEIWCINNADTMAVSSAAYTQVLDFDNDGLSNQCSPDHTNDHIEIDVDGDYLVTISISVENDTAHSFTLDFKVHKNNGATAFDNLHAHRVLAGGAGDKGSLSISGIIELSDGDTVELWAESDDATSRDIIVGDCTMSVVQVGGA